eukprot:GHVP01026122.1.p1 GENE.GHVP01026122.1~~GHVP01026122.1.p1  ORF type:complete len:174 (-),score=28.34 GHVP01026122.1:123-644(-)
MRDNYNATTEEDSTEEVSQIKGAKLMSKVYEFVKNQNIDIECPPKSVGFAYEPCRGTVNNERKHHNDFYYLIWHACKEESRERCRPESPSIEVAKENQKRCGAIEMGKYCGFVPLLENFGEDSGKVGVFCDDPDKIANFKEIVDSFNELLPERFGKLRKKKQWKEAELLFCSF